MKISMQCSSAMQCGKSTSKYLNDTSEEARSSVPLSKWILSFQKSDSLLIPALRLSCSLADEICKLLETGRPPHPGVNWMDSIVVYSQPNNNDLKGGGIEGRFLTDDYNDNIHIEILPTLFDKADISDDVRQVNELLYSLGIVFYQIFSRGERPAELEQKQNGETPANSVLGNVTEELSEGFDPFHSGGGAADVNEVHNLLNDYNLSDDDSTSYNDMAFQGGDGPTARKKRVQNENYHSCSVSVEPLKQKGVPMSVCDLIANMLDSVNGTLPTDETYHDMSDVRDDLQLMLDKPSKYLYDQDVGMLSSTGLQVGDTMYGRNAELSTIKEAYRRAVSGGNNELVTIYGKSGTGKSTLALEFGDFVSSDGGIFLFGKFDQRQQGKPFSALASAFNQYCGILLRSGELASSRQRLAHQINHVLVSNLANN